MLYKILNEINNFFEVNTDGVVMVFSAKTITGNFGYTYYPNQYIRINGSLLNDGVYKVVSLVGNVLTIEETLTDEDTNNIAYISGLSIPNDIISLATEISTFNSGSEMGVVSESQGNRSVTYSSGTWQGVFKSKLAPYKKLRW